MQQSRKSTVKQADSGHFVTLTFNSEIMDLFVNLQYDF